MPDRKTNCEICGQRIWLMESARRDICDSCEALEHWHLVKSLSKANYIIFGCPGCGGEMIFFKGEAKKFCYHCQEDYVLTPPFEKYETLDEINSKWALEPVGGWKYRKKETDQVLENIRILKNSPGEMTQARAAVKLGELGDHRAARALVEHLNPTFGRSYDAAFEAVKKLGGAALRQFFPLGPSTVFVSNVLTALKECADGESIELLSSLVIDPSREYVYVAIHYLGGMGQAGKQELIKALYLLPPDAYPSHCLAEYLGKNQWPEALDALFYALRRNSNSWNVSEFSKAIIGLAEHITVPALDLLHEPDWQVQQIGLMLLEIKPDERSLPEIKQRFLGTESNLRYPAARALKRYGNRVLDFLSQAIVSDNRDLQRMVMRTLVQIRTRGVIRLLGKACQSPDIHLRLGAISALIDIRNPLAIQFLMNMLTHKSPITRYDTLRGLEKFYFSSLSRCQEKEWLSIPWKEVLHSVQPLTTDPHKKIRQEAEWLVGLIQK